MNTPAGAPPALDVRYVANLARLTLTDAEAARYGAQLNAVLAYVGQLNELDVSGIEPTAHAAPRYNVMREDRAGRSLDQRLVIANAPAQVDDRYIEVPAVLGETEEGA